ncbi:hypothetical protein BDB01DRAFT_772493 [Pilobolus umbonatus]|nr:hypothetical protein BDB01DRAFT_772493 [Pilobolus umbonatus]
MTKTTSHPHQSESDQGLATLKNLTASLDGWTLESEVGGVKLYKSNPAQTNELVRGDYTLKRLPPGCTIKEAAAVATLPGCRKIWDSRYSDSKVIKYYERYESLFWVKMNAPWPVYPRDFAGASVRQFNEKEAYVCMLSVEDDLVPQDKDSVRGNIIISGWKLSQEGNNLNIVYVNQVDLAGNIPKAILNKLAINIPQCAGKVGEYLTQYGFPPTTTTGKHVEFINEWFDHGKAMYTCEVNGQHGDMSIYCCQMMYPQGVKVDVEGDAELKQDKDQHNNYTIQLSKIQGHIKVTLTKK